MEERRSAHRVMQRHLGDPPEDPPPVRSEESPETAERTPNPTAEPATPQPVGPRGPSDTALRVRQQAWRRERARFEASKSARPPADEGSK